MKPLAISDSMVLPPAPVAWKISTSKPWASSASSARLTHAVVLPNMLAVMRGFVVDNEGFQPALPDQIAHKTKFFALSVQAPTSTTGFGMIDLLMEPEQL